MIFIESSCRRLLGLTMGLAAATALVPAAGCSHLRTSDRSPRIVLIVGESEYETALTVPAFAREELEPRGFRCVVLHVNPLDPYDFPPTDALDEADLLVLSVRRRGPLKTRLAAVRSYLRRGRPLVAIRMASHAFDRPTAPAGHETWRTFGPEVLGAEYLGHYDNIQPGGPRTIVRAAPGAAGHPILAGLPREPFAVGAHLYRFGPLASTATPLLIGHVDGHTEQQPVAWTNVYHGGRVFYTSLGHKDDFRMAAFRHLLVNGVLWALDRPLVADPT